MPSWIVPIEVEFLAGQERLAVLAMLAEAFSDPERCHCDYSFVLLTNVTTLSGRGEHYWARRREGLPVSGGAGGCVSMARVRAVMRTWLARTLASWSRNAEAGADEPQIGGEVVTRGEDLAFVVSDGFGVDDAGEELTALVGPLPRSRSRMRWPHSRAQLALRARAVVRRGADMPARTAVDQGAVDVDAIVGRDRAQHQEQLGSVWPLVAVTALAARYLRWRQRPEQLARSRRAMIGTGPDTRRTARIFVSGVSALRCGACLHRFATPCCTLSSSTSGSC